MQLYQLLQFLTTLAPPIYQESYDNSGLLVGNPSTEITGVLTCLDSTEAVLDEAIEKNCNVIVAHHPIIFKGLKSLTGKTYIERVVMKAVKHDLAIYAIHTNLDNMYYKGVNAKIAERLALQNTRVLSPKAVLKKVNVFVPTAHSEEVRAKLTAISNSSFNRITPVSFSSLGVQNKDKQNTAVIKLEVRYTKDQERVLFATLKGLQADTNLLYEISTIENVALTVGAGMIGKLANPMQAIDFLDYLKQKMQVKCVRHTKLLDKPIQKVAVCGGAGGFLLSKAKQQKADIFITADYKYHEFFNAEEQILIADIGHYESEQFTIDLLKAQISNNFPNFAVLSTTVNTNPVFYY